MILSLESVLQKVFMIFGVFWIVVVLGLYLWIGVLLKKHDRLAQKGHGAGDHH